jgi:hypothetical protein
VVCDVVVLYIEDGSELTFSYSRTPYPCEQHPPGARDS